MTWILALGALLAFITPSSAQPPSRVSERAATPQSTIVVQVADLGCESAAGSNSFVATDYSFGARQTLGDISGGGGVGGKPTLSELAVTKSFDECSPALLGGVVTGKHFQFVNLIQRDKDGNPVLTIELSNVLISSYQISGSESGGERREPVSFDFVKICITEPRSNNRLCFDSAQNKAS